MAAVTVRSSSRFSLHRVGAVMLRQAYLYRRTFHRWLEIFYWPTMELLVWGFLTVYLERTDGVSNVAKFILGALLLWDILFRAQQTVAVGFLEDVWGRNVLNMWASPIRPSEYVIGTIAIGLLRIAIGAAVAMTLAFLFFDFSIFTLGLSLLPFLVLLLAMGWAIGLVSTALILRFGQGFEELAWALVFLFQPFSAVFYPVDVLPPWAEAIANAIPASHVFEGMRRILNGGPFPTGELLAAVVLDVLYLLGAWALFTFMLRQVRRRGLLSRFGE
jgi:ABC-2 type transport system permease protein